MSSKLNLTLTDTDVSESINTNAIQLVEQMDRAVITDIVTCGKVADMKKMLSTIVSDIEDGRAKKLKPYKTYIKVVTDVYATSLAPVKKGVERAKNLLDEWAKKELLREREEQEKINAENEQKLLDAAIVQDDSGNTDNADALIEYAQDASNTTAKMATVRGSFGASMGARSTWNSEVKDVKEICAAIGRGDLPQSLVTFSKSGLNDYAKSVKKECVQFGLKIVENISSITR